MPTSSAEEGSRDRDVTHTTVSRAVSVCSINSGGGGAAPSMEFPESDTRKQSAMNGRREHRSVDWRSTRSSRTEKCLREFIQAQTLLIEQLLSNASPENVIMVAGEGGGAGLGHTVDYKNRELSSRQCACSGRDATERTRCSCGRAA